MKIIKSAAVLAALIATAASAHAAPNVQITEVMYTGLFGEFVEITNVGTSAQSMTGWTFSDSRRGITAGTNATSLSQIGSLAVGESAIITEVSDTIFIQAWYTEPGKTALPASRIVENNSINLGRTDEVNIYPAGVTDAVNGYQDRLTYTDQTTTVVGAQGPRSEDVSAVPTGNSVSSTFSAWELSAQDIAGVMTPEGNAWKAGVAGAPGPFGSPGVFPNL